MRFYFSNFNANFQVHIKVRRMILRTQHAHHQLQQNNIKTQPILFHLCPIPQLFWSKSQMLSHMYSFSMNFLNLLMLSNTLSVYTSLVVFLCLNQYPSKFHTLWLMGFFRALYRFSPLFSSGKNEVIFFLESHSC